MTQSTTQHFRGKAVSYTPKFPNRKYQQNDSGHHRNFDNGALVHHVENIDSLYVQKLKPEYSKKSCKATGQYTRLTATQQKMEFFIDRDNPDRIYRRDKTSTVKPVLVLEKINGEWFPCIALKASDLVGFKPFIGSAVIDPDQVIDSNRRSVKRVGSTGRGTKHELEKLDKHAERVKNHVPVKRQKVSIR